MHGFGLLWHAGCSLLVMVLARRLLGDRRWALLAGLLFAWHPGHGATCERIADQNEVMTTFFALASLAAYAQYARWPSGAMSASFRRHAYTETCSGRPGWLALALLCFAAGLGCRENAMVVPALVLVFDLLIGRLPWRRRLAAYACYGLLAAGYLGLRYHVLGGMPMPGLPYMYPPGEPGFVRYVFEKLLFYQLGLYLYVPALQLTWFEFFQRNPLLLYALSGAVLTGLAALLVRTTGSCRAGWGLLIWPMICLGPVLFVFAGLHHLYLPSTGSSILLTGLVMHLGRLGRSAFWKRLRKPVVLAGLIGYAGGSILTGLLCYRLTEVERGHAERLAAAVDTARDGDHVFVLNFPPLAFYTAPAVGEATGAGDLTVHALSVRRHGGPEARARALDERRLLLWIPQGPPADPHQSPSRRPFEALVERQITVLVPAAGGLGPLPPVGTVLNHGEFDAHLLGTDEQGASVWLLEFAQPLGSPRYHFCAFTCEGKVEGISLVPVGTHEDIPESLLKGLAAQRVAPANG